MRSTSWFMSMAIAVACAGGCSNNEPRELSRPESELGAQQVQHIEDPEQRSGGARSERHIEDPEQRSGGARAERHIEDPGQRSGGARSERHIEDPEQRSGGARAERHIEDPEERTGGARAVPHAGDDEGWRQTQQQDRQYSQQQQQQVQQQQQMVEGQLGALDDRIFAVMLLEPGKAGVRDDLIFQDGTFESSACRQYGFTPAPYEAHAMDDGSVHFTAETRSGDATILWDGTATAGRIAGTAIKKEPGKEPVHMTFNGTPTR